MRGLEPKLRTRSEPARRSNIVTRDETKSQRSKFRISSRENLHSNLPKITLWEGEAFS